MSDNEGAFDDDVQIHTTKTVKKPVRPSALPKTLKSNEEVKPDRVAGGRVEKPIKKPEKKFKKNLDSSEIRSSASSGGNTSSKAAKFSSLFKNNHEIPTVGDIKAKNAVQEGIFSSKLFSECDKLSPHVIDCLQKRFSLETMTQIQAMSIPAILDGRDCFVKSQTGSGKTLAYALPIVQRLQERMPRIKRTDGIFALVLVPTRELALQTCQVIEKLCNACVWIVAGCLIGGMKKKSEKDRIRRGLNILVATPGRLCDHLDTTQALDLSKIEFLIFDEADRMLDLDFEKKINFIIFKIHSSKKKMLAEPVIPKFRLDENGEPVEEEGSGETALSKRRIDPQTILISATLTSGIKEIARRLNVADPMVIDASDDHDPSSSETRESNQIEKVAMPSKLTHYYVMVPSKLRLIVLVSFILDKFLYNSTKKSNKMIIFASTNDSVLFHENVLSTFVNRKFNMYTDDDDDLAGSMGDNYDSDPDTDALFDKHSGSKSKREGKSANLDEIRKKKNTVCEIFALYGNMDQHKRAEVLANFCKASSGVMISTDVAARGLDMPNIDWIVQYNTPGTSVDYIHRVGRSARVGHRGQALLFLEPCEVAYLAELNKLLEISLREIKMTSIMECLIDEAKYYPRQINSDRLVYPHSTEECANSMQFYVEEFVEKTGEMQSVARRAYISFLRSYAGYTREWKAIFNLKNLHLGHVAKSFGLREAPREIAGKEINIFKGSRSGTDDSNRMRTRDGLESKHARDLKRLANNHREYGNVIKKNKQKSQQATLDLSGLLKRQKTVSEFASGLESLKPARSENRPARVMKSSSKTAPDNSEKPVRPKLAKKDMSIFD